MSTLVMIWDAKGEPFEVPAHKVERLVAQGFSKTPFHRGGIVNVPKPDVPSILKPHQTIIPKKRRSAKVKSDE